MSSFTLFAEETSTSTTASSTTATETSATATELSASSNADATDESGTADATTESSATETTESTATDSDTTTKKTRNKKKTEEETTPETKSASKTVITILSAQKTEYAKSEEGNDIIVLIGSVQLSVEQNGTKTIVSADTVTYERARQRLYAEGSVVLEKMSGTTVTETITADSILFNSENQEGVFNKGRVTQNDSDMIKLDSSSSLVVSSDLFARSATGVIGFKNGKLSFCDEDEPHWLINATRIWLLPGNEFAFFNAVFSVGYIPVLYLPFFYYPKDEMIFNPVLGYDGRKGYYLQTSTYLIGRKSTSTTDDDEDNFFSFLNTSSNKKQIREGLFLHNLDEDETNSSSDYLRILGDYYTTLGGMVGIQGSFTPGKVLTGLDFSLLTGFSNTIFKNSYGYTIYDSADDYATNYDNGYFFGYTIPFRFYGNLKATISYSPISFTLSMPLYSDPYFDNDFITSRTESMNWLSVITDGLTDDESTSTVVSGVSSYTWQGTLNVNPKISALNPYITTLNLSNLKASILFNSTTNTSLEGNIANYSPNRKFYYPAQVVPASGTINIAGTLFSYPGKTTSSSKKTEKVEKNGFEDKFVTPDFLTEKEVSEEKNASEELPDNEEKNASEEQPDVEEKNESEEQPDVEEKNESEELPDAEVQAEDELVLSALPDLKVSSYTTSTSSTINYNLTYSIVPNFDSLIVYNENKVSSPEEIDFSEEYFKSTYWKLSGTAQLTSSLSLFDSILSLSNNFKFTPAYQDHPVISEDYYTTETERQKITLADYSAFSMNLTNTNSIAVKPFVYLPVVYDTNFSWNSVIQIVDTEFTGTYDEPEWNYKLPEWDDDGIPTHNLTFNLVSKEDSFSQTLSLVSTLPPVTSEYTMKLALVFPYVSLSAESGFTQLEIDSDGDGVVDSSFESGTYFYDYEVKPIKESLSMSFFDKKFTVSQAFQYNMEEKHATSLSFSLSGWGVSASYTMQYTLPYTLTEEDGWVAEDEKKFLPYTASLKYTLPSQKYRWWKNRIIFSPGFNTSITADLIKPTSSYFLFNPSFSFEITDFLTITFASSSRNDVIFRYVQSLFDYEVEIPGEKNIFKDLWYSFDFANVENRQNSGFKIKSFSIKLTHDLHDWSVNSEFSVSPRLITDEFPYRYDFSPYFTLSVVWKPMENFKTQIEDEYGEFTLNPD
ncbi:MAG: hypothetical protein K6G52_02405 [Treponemataceae bacterium]|nr:hypothetical protein [Treponemataceae bacterium]